MIPQQSARRKNHSRLAESALRHLFLQPRALTWMTRVARQSFDRNEIAPLCVARGNLAGKDRLSILKDRTRTAGAHAAAKFCPGQGESVTQDPNQRGIVVNVN